MLKFREGKSILLVTAIFLFLIFCGNVFAANFILNDLSGLPVDVSNFKGQPVILFFWTTWCPYCREELKNLNRQYAQMTKEGIVVLAVNVQEPEYRIKKFFTGYTLNFRVLLDRSGLLFYNYNLMGVPTFIFLDRLGQVVSRTNRLPLDYKSLLFKTEDK